MPRSSVLILATLGFTFAAAFAIERVGLAWHRARERGQRWRRAWLGMLHEALAWAPLLVAIESGAAPAVAVAAVLGVGLANAGRA